MSARGLSPQTVVIPFGVGLNQKMDPRALQVPSLTRCLDCAFTETGGLQLRYPYASIGASIFGGGTVSDCRRIVENGNELLLFTKTALYSWSAQLSKWVLKGTHLAVKVAEESKFVTTGDQVGCDRAELNGTVIYGWTDVTTGYVAAVDATTGSMLMAPTAIVGPATRLRLTALATKILLTFHDEIAGTYCYALDPSSPATALAGASTTLSPTGGGYYDIVKQPGADAAVFAARLAPTTSYRVGTIANTGVVTSSTVARTCTGPIAVSCEPLGTHVQIARANGTAIQGDLIAISGFADVYTAQAIGTASTTVQQIAAAHRSAQDGGAYRCYVFWGAGETTAPGNFRPEYNYVTTANTLGTEVGLGFNLGIASRAFDHDGRVFVWLVFPGTGTGAQFGVALQNSYFLYRDDGFLCAKATMHRAGGFAAKEGVLPGVQAIASGQYAWCGQERRVIPTGSDGSSNYGARAPRDIVITFDSNEARRTARLGQTLYLTGGEILQYDQVRLTEVGFHLFPYQFVITSNGFASSHTDGVYSYMSTYRWDNAVGDVDRSTTASIKQVTVSGGPLGIVFSDSPGLYVTHKTDNPVSIEVWRTTVNPTIDSPFYLVTSKDPGDSGLAANEYIPNPTAFVVPSLGDAYSDATASTKENHAENGGLLEYLAPPAATIIAATADRLFLAGVAGDPHRVWYSRQRNDGEVASFNDALTADVPRAGGDITAIAVRDGVLYVWREAAIYALPGDGFDNLGQGQNFGPARLISADVGCVSMEALAQTSAGYVFKSSKGWYVLEGASVQYIGDKVSDYDSDTVYAVHVLESQHQIRVLTSARMLVFDTSVQQWAEWTVADGLHAALWNGTYHYLATAKVKAEQTTYSAVTYSMDVETADIPVGSPLSFGRVWKAIILGEFRTTHRIRVRLAKNYATTYFQDKVSDAITGTAGDPLTLKHSPSIQEMHAIRIRISTYAAELDEGVYVTPSVECLKLTFLVLELGVERHLTRHAAQSQ